MTTIDSYHRAIDYLRVSVTDRCNLRCVYCMPPGGVPARAHDEILNFEAIRQLVSAAVGMGFRKIRLTGGEPLVRRGVVHLVEQLAAIPGIEDIAMTTNAVLLDRFAPALAEAGLTRVNVSFDTLDPERFRRITRVGDLSTVWRGILAADAAGLTPLKLNMVVVRGLNDDEVIDVARLTYKHDWHVRFIEVMPLAGPSGWEPGMPLPETRLVPAAEIRERLAVLGPLTPVDGPGGNGPARYYRLAGARGTLGFITAMSDHFCASCNRLRLTADGWLRSCLFSEQGVHMKPALDSGADLAEIQALIRQAIDLKPAQHSLVPDTHVAEMAMSRIGG